MTEKCFKKCISKPGTSLDSSEQVRMELHCCFVTHIHFIILEMCGDVYGPIYGFVEPHIKGV